MLCSTSASDVTLTLSLPRTVFVAGDRVQGMLDVSAQRDLRVTAIRLSIIGAEKARYVPQKFADLSSLAPLFEDFDHYRKHITLFGATAASGEKKNTLLTRGQHRFGIDLQLPFSCPPSFHCAIRGAASTLTYTMRVALYRTSSHSADRKDTIQQRIVLLAAVPQRQLAHAQVCEYRMAREMVQVNSRSKSAMPERVLVEASLYPSLLLLQPPDVFDPSDNGAGTSSGGAALAAVPPTDPTPTTTMMTATNGNHNDMRSPLISTVTSPMAAVTGTPLLSRTDGARDSSLVRFNSAEPSPSASPLHPSPGAATCSARATSSGPRTLDGETQAWCSHVAVVSHGPPLTPSQRRAVAFFPRFLESLHTADSGGGAGGDSAESRQVNPSTEAAQAPAPIASAPPAEPATRSPSRLASPTTTLTRLQDFQRLQRARAFKVSVSITNTSSDTPLSAIRVTLLQQRHVKVRGASQRESVTLASAEVRDPAADIQPREGSSSSTSSRGRTPPVSASSPFGAVRCPHTFTELDGFCVKPGEHVRLDVTLVLAEESMPLVGRPARRFNALREVLRMVPEQEKHMLLPSLYTPFLDASCVLEVSFPGISTSKKANGKSYVKKGAVVISSAVDFTNTAWMAPATYDLHYSPPEENAGTPASVTETTNDSVAGEQPYLETHGGAYEYTPLIPGAP